MTNETASLKLKAGPPFRAVKVRPSISNRTVTAWPAGSGTAVAVARNIEHLGAVKDGHIVPGGFLGLGIKPQAGGDFFCHCFTSSPCPAARPYRRRCGLRLSLAAGGVAGTTDRRQVPPAHPARGRSAGTGPKAAARARLERMTSSPPRLRRPSRPAPA